MSNIVCFGEVLWDVFPTHKKIGGAPLNVALRLKSFKNNVVIISSIGDDEDGKALLEYIKESGIDCSEIQTNHSLQTSKVKVFLDNKASASYDIEMPCAWDYIEVTKSAKTLIKASDVFIFGSLVARTEYSKASLLQYLDEANFKVFDVNLRPPHYQMSSLLLFMEKADLVKFNDDELLEICKFFGFKSEDITKNIEFIAKKTNTNHICVTLGENGALFYRNGQFYSSQGYRINVEDTVGAGDSFLATFVHGILNDNTPQEILDKACAVGALVASKKGANPLISENEITSIMTA